MGAFPKRFPISRDPPEGGTRDKQHPGFFLGAGGFPISRDPPEGGTRGRIVLAALKEVKFPISRDPPEGGTLHVSV